eukprot:5964982-Pyramimonas_sp.AAC.1
MLDRVVRLLSTVVNRPPDGNAIGILGGCADDIRVPLPQFSTLYALTPHFAARKQRAHIRLQSNKCCIVFLRVECFVSLTSSICFRLAPDAPAVAASFGAQPAAPHLGAQFGSGGDTAA